MSYIAQLRSLVGTRPLILPGTSVLVVDDEGRLLLVERADIGGWGLPGGFMELGESFEETGVREVYEELGLKIADLSLLGVFSGPEYYFRYPHGDEVYNVTAAFTARPLGPVQELDPAEIASARYFALDELPEGIITPEQPIVDYYLERVLGVAGTRDPATVGPPDPRR